MLPCPQQRQSVSWLQSYDAVLFWSAIKQPCPCGGCIGPVIYRAPGPGIHPISSSLARLVQHGIDTAGVRGVIPCVAPLIEHGINTARARGLFPSGPPLVRRMHARSVVRRIGPKCPPRDIYCHLLLFFATTVCVCVCSCVCMCVCV